MAHADDATKAWVSAIPKKNADGNVIEWNVKYKYTLAATGKDDFVHTFDKTEKIDTPSKAPDKYTKAELLTLMDKDHWDDMFNKKYGVYIATAPVETIDASFDVSTLSDS
jgi:putative sterol carrier protein